MRLISCHIENFGKLHDFGMTFSDGLNVIFRENGWGKSTLAAFIKAMLYGLDGTRKQSIEVNERKRFAPWQGGIFGGRLDFAVGERIYSVSRTFGETPAKDTFELRDGSTNLVSHDYSVRLGEELFRLNSESFYRSIFIGQSDCPTSSTDDIHAKIGNLADNTGDINSYEAAESRLAKQINRLNPTRSSGSVYKLSGEISELRRKTEDGKMLEELIADNEKMIAQTQLQKLSNTERKAECEQIQKKAIAIHNLSLRRGEWERLKKDSTDAKNALDKAEAFFPEGVPDGETVQRNLRKSVEMKSAECLMNSYELSRDEKSRLETYQKQFESGPPSAEEIENQLSDGQELRRIREKYDRLRLTSEERGWLDWLMCFFAKDTVLPSEMSESWNQRTGRLHALSSKRDALAAVTESYRRNLRSIRRRTVLLIVSGVLLIAAGVALLFIFSKVLMLSISVAGGLLIALGIMSSVTGRMIRPPDEMLRLKSDIDDDEEVIEYIANNVRNYLESHGRVYNEQFAGVMLQELCGDHRELDALMKKSETAECFISGSRLSELDESISSFLRKYGITPDKKRYSDLLYELKETITYYEQLRAKADKYDEALENYTTVSLELSKFIASVGYSESDNIQETLQLIHDRISDCARLREQYSASVAELKAFEESCDTSAFASRDDENIPSLESVAEEISVCSARIEELNNSLVSLEQAGKELYDAFSRWEDNCCLLAEKTRQRESDRKKYERLKKASELLRRAKENMTAKYIKPVSSGFDRYYELISGESSDSYRIDADIRVTVEKLGGQRETEALSTGYRDLTGICLRLALVDAMYREEKPPLIMDDPFTNLDDAKTSASGRLLSAVSQNCQIIYFTCSTSRCASLE